MRGWIWIAGVWLVVAPARAELIAHWKLDQIDSGPMRTTPDASVYTNEAYLQEYTGSIQVVPGVAGNAFNFTQIGSNTNSDQHLNAADVPHFDRTYTQLTACAWIWPDTNAPSQNQYILGRMGGYTGVRGWQFYLDADLDDNGPGTDAGLTATFYDGPSGTQQKIRFAHLFSPTGFSHIAFVFKASEYADMYIDGDRKLHETNDVLTVLNMANAQLLQIANRGNSIEDSGGWTRSFDGCIDDVQFYDEALSSNVLAAIVEHPGYAYGIPPPPPPAVSNVTLMIVR